VDARPHIGSGKREPGVVFSSFLVLRLRLVDVGRHRSPSSAREGLLEGPSNHKTPAEEILDGGFVM
jgi:hypothetical protein